MSDWRLFGAALALPVLFTTVVLIGVVRNRSGSGQSIELTEREVALSTGSDENSGMTAWVTWSFDVDSRSPWLSADTLRAFGFDVTVDPGSPAGDRAYARQLQRQAYIALELRDEPARRSRLVPVDASPRVDELLEKYPNRRTHLITSGVVGIRRNVRPGQRPFVDGYLVSLDPRGIHVPTRLAERLRRRGGRTPRFTLTVRYGSRLEPWIVDAR